MFYELDLIAFTGSHLNKKYHNKKLVLWDNRNKTEICTSQFMSIILSIKVLKKLIFIGTKEEIKICEFNEQYNLIETTSTIQLDSNDSTNFEVWYSKIEKKYYIASVTKTSYIKITPIYESCHMSVSTKTFNTEFNYGIQNIIYEDKTDMLIVINLNGTNIKCYDCTDFTPKFEFYRGNSYSNITSVISIKCKYLAVGSMNKTIHLFDLTQQKPKEASNGLFSQFFNLFINYQLNKSILKIRFDELGEKKNFFEADFKAKGTILIYNEELNELTALGYNGVIYIISIDFDKLEYKIKNTFNWCFSDEVKTSVYISEEYSLDLITLNNKKIGDEKDNENWKIV